jgi:hypothetical protein
MESAAPLLFRALARQGHSSRDAEPDHDPKTH